MPFVGIQKVTGSVLVSFLVAVCLNGCATVPSEALREQARPIAFEELLKNAQEFERKKVILGGYIIETLNEPTGTQLVILQSPLDSQNEPKSQDLSEGRFLIETKDFLDPVVFSKDRKLTVGGTVHGTITRQLGNTTYSYPIIESIELHLWPKEVLYPEMYDPYYLYRYRHWHLYDPYLYPWW